MIRHCSLEDISDGKLYELNDMVKVHCNDCKGCSDCCKGMGNSIVLDPLDMFRLTSNLKCTFEEMLKERISLNVVDGIILPNINMNKQNEKCGFLNDSMRCSIHAFRPGICRLFPLGRYYEEEGFKYILQVNECLMPNKSKVKVKKWIDTANLVQYEKFIQKWHNLLKAKRMLISEAKDDLTTKSISMSILNNFYINGFSQCKNEEEFYIRFHEIVKFIK